MTPYILSLLAATLAAALVELLAPRGEGGKLASSIRLSAGLFLLVALLSPLREGLHFLQDLSDGALELPAPDAPDYESTFQASLAALGKEELSVWVQGILATEFDIPLTDTEVVPLFADSSAVPPPLVELRIVLCGSAILKDPHPIEDYFVAALGVPCRVSVALI